MTGPDDPYDGQHDDQLRERVRRADPARDLPAATQAEIGDLTRAARAGTPTRRHPGRLVGVAAAAAVVVVAGASWAIGDHGSGSGTPTVAAPLTTAPSEPPSEPPSVAPSGATGTTRLTLAPQAGRCAVPTAATLRAQSLVVVATASSVQDGTATLSVAHVYRGAVGTEVTVTTPSADDGLTPTVDFAVGQRYLVSATDGVVAGCGLSGPLDGPESGPVTALVEDAFGG